MHFILAFDIASSFTSRLIAGSNTWWLAFVLYIFAGSFNTDWLALLSPCGGEHSCPACRLRAEYSPAVYTTTATRRAQPIWSHVKLEIEQHLVFQWSMFPMDCVVLSSCTHSNLWPQTDISGSMCRETVPQDDKWLDAWYVWIQLDAVSMMHYNYHVYQPSQGTANNSKQHANRAQYIRRDR